MEGLIPLQPQVQEMPLRALTQHMCWHRGILNTAYGATIPYFYTADTDTYSLGILSPGKYTVKADGWNWDYSNSIYGYSTPTVEVRTSTGYLLGTGYLGSHSFNVTQANTFYVSVVGTSYASSEYEIYYTYDGALPNSPTTSNPMVPWQLIGWLNSLNGENLFRCQRNCRSSS